jgi:hypothetical protein
MLLMRQEQGGKISIVLVLVHVPVHAMVVLCPTVWLTFKREKGKMNMNVYPRFLFLIECPGNETLIIPYVKPLLIKLEKANTNLACWRSMILDATG